MQAVGAIALLASTITTGFANAQVRKSYRAENVVVAAVSLAITAMWITIAVVSAQTPEFFRGIAVSVIRPAVLAELWIQTAAVLVIFQDRCSKEITAPASAIKPSSMDSADAP